MRKPTICICENKDADQVNAKLISAFVFATRIVHLFKSYLLLISEISSFKPASVTVQLDLCWTCSETTLLVFPRGGSNKMKVKGVK